MTESMDRDPPRIFLAGATGFIGGHILRGLLRAGHAVTCLIWPGQALTPTLTQRERRALPLPLGEGLRMIEGQWTRPAEWVEAVAGHAAVVNAVGVIREGPGSTFAAVQTEAPGALFRAAARAGARQLVQISALGADAGVRTPFLLTKRAADELALGLGVPAVVLRPSVVYGPGDHSMAFFRRLAALPVTPVPGDGRYRLQPVHVDDLVRAVVLACARPGRHGAFDLGGGTVLTFNALLHALARHRGRRRARLLHVPWPLMRLVARLTDLAGRGPITTDELTMLRRGSVADNGPFVATFGFAPRPFRPG